MKCSFLSCSYHKLFKIYVSAFYFETGSRIDLRMGCPAQFDVVLDMALFDFEAEILGYNRGHLGAISDKIWRGFHMVFKNGASYTGMM